MSLMPTDEGYELMLEDKDEFIGFQFDVELGEGVTINSVRLAGVGEYDHVLTCNDYQHNSYTDKEKDRGRNPN